ncbi:MAG: biotin carboxyl carrier protein [Nitrososphaerota archaeon]
MGREIKFVDTTLRDGNQSLWGAAGIKAGMILSIAEAFDQAGFKAIDFVSSIHMGMSVRYHKENPWEVIRLVRQKIKNTPLSFGTTGRRFIGFKRMPDSIMSLVYERMVANGIRRIWIIDAAHEVGFLLKAAKMAKEKGFEEVVIALCFTISPVHTDEFYAKVARELAASPHVDTIYIKDQGGLLTPERVRTLVPAVKKAIGEKCLEFHSHCNTGLAPICYLEAIRLGVDVVHTACPPLANGTSQPSIFNILHNITYDMAHKTYVGQMKEVLPSWTQGLGEYTTNVNVEALKAISDFFHMVAERENLPIGKPEEHDASYYVHQLPGGMVTTLKRQLQEMGIEEKLPQVMEEIVRVRQELGYPIMVTPFSQFVGTQATMNVIYKERYKVVPDGIIQYAAGWFGPPPAPIDPDVLDKIRSQPKAKEYFDKEVPQLSVEEIRRQMGLGPEVSDEEFLLRYSMTDQDVDEMLKAGPIKTTYP